MAVLEEQLQELEELRSRQDLERHQVLPLFAGIRGAAKQ